MAYERKILANSSRLTAFTSENDRRVERMLVQMQIYLLNGPGYIAVYCNDKFAGVRKADA